MPDIDFKSDLGPVARKMIHYWGFEPEISRVLGRDAHEYMNFNYQKLSEDMLLSCIGARVPVKKVLRNLVTSKH